MYDGGVVGSARTPALLMLDVAPDGDSVQNAQLLLSPTEKRVYTLRDLSNVR